jgi:hypothetical protein
MKATALEVTASTVDRGVAGHQSDDLGSHGIEYRDARDEHRRRETERAESARAAEWDRCRASFADGAILVDHGTPGERGVYGWIPGDPERVYYAVCVIDDWAKVADDARVIDVAGELVGSLALVADQIASGRLRIVRAAEVPPEPVTRRIGHERYREIARVQVSDRVLWVGRPNPGTGARGARPAWPAGQRQALACLCTAGVRGRWWRVSGERSSARSLSLPC